MNRTILVLGVWAGLAAGLTRAEGAPRIQFDKTVCDLGRTSEVQRVSGRFVVRNTGDAVLKLSPPAPSCSCIEATLSAESVDPGQQAELNFAIKLPPARMLIDKFITVTSNDPHNPRTDLKVKLDYVPLYDLLPMYLILGDVRLGATTNKTVLVNRTDGQRLALSKAEAPGPWITATLAAATNHDDRAARVLIEIKPEGPPRDFTEFVRVFSTNSIAPAFTIPIYGRIVGP